MVQYYNTDVTPASKTIHSIQKRQMLSLFQPEIYAQVAAPNPKFSSAMSIETEPHTDAVLVDLNGSVVHLGHCLHLQVVAIAVVTPLPIDVLLKVLRDKLREVVGILQLQGRWGGGEKE